MIEGFTLEDANDEYGSNTLWIRHGNDDDIIVVILDGRGSETAMCVHLADVITGLALLYPELNIQTKRANNA